MKTYLGIFSIIMIICITSCDKDDDQNGNPIIIEGCTDEEAFNYDSTATEDDGSCIPIIYGCIDVDAYNYDSNANTDDDSCDYSIASQFDGEWVVSVLDYEGSIDLSPIASMIDDFTIQLALLAIGNQFTIEGQAQDAGSYILNYDDFTYEGILAFSTEEQTIADLFTLPSVPINLESQGTWELQNNDEILVFIDLSTGLQQTYEVMSITENSAYLKGLLNLPIDVFDLPIEASQIINLLGEDYEFPINMDLQLDRVN